MGLKDKLGLNKNKGSDAVPVSSGGRHRKPEEPEVDVTAQDQSADGSDQAEGEEKKKSLSHMLGLGANSDKKVSRDKQLASVVNESEPGTVIDIMKQNEPFALPDDGGWVVLILPTDDPSFGGLARAYSKRNAEKGNIINLLNTGSLKYLATGDLLDDNALALIPNEQTLQRMFEFELLANARYMYGVATRDPETGDLMVFSVPSKRGSFSDGQIYEEANSVSEGKLALAEVVDFGLIDAMLTIFEQADDPDDPDTPYGSDGVLQAMSENFSLIADMRATEDRYPTGDEMVDHLIDVFPQLGNADATAYGENDEPAVDEEELDIADIDPDALPEGVDPQDIVDAQYGYDPEDTDAEVFEGDNDDALDAEAEADDNSDVLQKLRALNGGSFVVNSAANDEDVEFAHEPVDDDIDFVDDEVSDAPVDEDGAEGVYDTDDSVESAPVQSGQVGQPGPGVSNPLAGSMSEEQFAALAEMINNNSINIDNRLADIMDLQLADRQAAQDAAYRSSDREFSREEVSQEILRTYSDDLDLHVEARPFYSGLGLEPKQIYEINSEPATPWLGDQLSRLLVDINTQLLSLNTEHTQERERMYTSLMSKAQADIAEDLDYNKPDSPWNEVYQAIQEDKANSKEQFELMVQNRRKELSEEYNRNFERFKESRLLKIEEEYDRLNKPQMLNRSQAVESEVMAIWEAAMNQSKQTLDDLRKEEARRRSNQAIDVVIESMQPMFEEHRRAEQKAYEDAFETISKYIETHRTDDLRQAAIWDEKLDHDTRLDEAREDFTKRLQLTQQEADNRVAEYKRHMEAQKDHFEAELRERSAMDASRESNMNARIADIERQAEERIEAARREVNDERDHSKDLVRKADERVAQAEANEQYAIEKANAGDKTKNMLLIILPVICILSGLIVGGVFF